METREKFPYSYENGKYTISEDEIFEKEPYQNSEDKSNENFEDKSNENSEDKSSENPGEKSSEDRGEAKFFDPYWKTNKPLPIISPPQVIKPKITNRYKLGKSKLYKKSRAEIDSAYSMFDRNENDKSRITIFGEGLEFGVDALQGYAKLILKQNNLQKKTINQNTIDLESSTDEEDEIATEYIKPASGTKYSLADFITHKIETGKDIETDKDIETTIQNINEFMEQALEVFEQCENQQETKQHEQYLDFLASSCNEIESMVSARLNQEGKDDYSKELALLEMLSTIMESYARRRFLKNIRTPEQ